MAFYDNVLVVGTPNEFTREIISTKYGPFLQRALFQLTGKEIDLKLVVDESPDTIRIPGTKKVELGTLAAADVYLVTTVVDLGVVSAVVFGVGWKRSLAERVLKSMA